MKYSQKQKNSFTFSRYKRHGVFLLIAGFLTSATLIGIAFSRPEKIPTAEAQTPIVANGDFSTGDLTSWTTAVVNPSQNSVTAVTDPDQPGNTVARLVVNNIGSVDYYSNTRLIQTGGNLNSLAAQTSYTITFRAKASVARPMEVDVVKLPYNFLGMQNPINIGTSWQTYTATFRTPDSMPATSFSLTFGAGNGLGTIWVDDITLTPTTALTYSGSSLQLASFDPGEVWSAGKHADTDIPYQWSSRADWFRAEPTHETNPTYVHEGSGSLKLSSGNSGNDYTERVIPVSGLSASNSWEMVAWVYVDQPVNFGRMVFTVRSGAVGVQAWTFTSVAGLSAGWNQVVMPKSKFFTWAWQNSFSWSAPWMMSIKLEANDNGPVNAWLDDLRIEPIVSDIQAPVLTYVSVYPITSTTATVTWTTDENATGRIDCGLTTAYGTTQTQGALSASHSFDLTNLAPNTFYHCQVSSADSGGRMGRSGDLSFTTDPSTDWVPPDPNSSFRTGLSGPGLSSIANTPPLFEIQDAERSRFSVFSGPSFEYDTDQKIKLYMDEMAAKHREVLIGLSRPDVASGNASAIANRVAINKDYPALIGWDMYDEPENNGINATNLHTAYLAVKQNDSNHPANIVAPQLSPSYPYLNSMDWGLVDSYPIPADKPSGVITTFDSAASSGKTFDAVLEGFEWDINDTWPGDWPLATRFVTRDELRSMAYLALNHGARNIYIYGYSKIRAQPGVDWHWVKVNDVINELMRLGPVLGSTGAPTINPISSTNSNFDVGVKQYAGKTYLIVVNKSVSTATGTINFNGLAISSAKEVVTQQTATSTSTSLSPSLGTYGVGVYELTPVDTTPPTVSISSPTNSSTVADDVTLTATATDNVFLAGVQFKVDGQNLGSEVTSAPYQTIWSTTYVLNGSHTITAVARDGAGNTTTSSPVTVSVNDAVPDTTPPTISITVPTNNATVSNDVSLTATASDNIGVVGVQFKVDGQNLGNEDATEPYQTMWSTTYLINGNHTITAIARDAAGNTTTSSSIILTVSDPIPDTTPPGAITDLRAP